MNYFSTRATVRRFKPEAPSADMIRNLVEQACHAPTTGGMQLYTIIETRTREGLDRLAPAHFNQPACTGAPVLLTFCVDLQRFSQWCRDSDAEPGYDNFQSFLYAGLDTAIVAQQFVTVAEQAGLGTCYLGTTTYNAPQISEALGLPEQVIPLLTVAVGYPEAPGVPSDRLPVDAVFAQERYPERTPGEVRDLYRDWEYTEPNSRFIAENGKETLAQVFTDVRYTRDANEHFSRVYLDLLKAKRLL